MPGMNAGLNTNNPTVVSAFKTALIHQALIVLLILAVVAVTWNVLRTVQLRRMAAGNGADASADGGVAAAGISAAAFTSPEPVARRLLRVSFGLIWIFDGILQGQASMPLGMAPQVDPAGRRRFPGLGAAPRQRHGHDLELPPDRRASGGGLDPGRHRRLAAGGAHGGLVAAGGPGQRRMGARRLGLRRGVRRDLRPRSHLAVRRARGGALLLRSPGRWSPSPNASGRRLGSAGSCCGRWACSSSAWPYSRPGRAGASGRAGRRPGTTPGTLTAMVRQMAQTPQPAPACLLGIGDFAAFDAAHGWAVNLFVVIALA